MLVVTTGQTLLPAERFALDVLVDLSTLVRTGDERASVRLEVVDDASAGTLASLRSRDWTISNTDGVVRLDRALLAFVAEVAGAEAEQRSTGSDRYGRVPSAESPLVQAGAEREPVVSLAARALRDAVRRAAGRRPFLCLDPWPQQRRWAVALTHDLDAVEWWPAFTLLRLSELARRGRAGVATRVLRAAVGSGGRDVVWEGVRRVLEIEARHQARSTWFVLCGTPTLASARAGDLTYRPESPLARRILSAVESARHEVGLHGSFATLNDHEQFVRQRARLASLVASPVTGVRQHYLRTRPGATPSGMRAAGFDYDSTAGFSDRNGFRLGVADLVPSWAASSQSALAMDEVPFTWMDRALSKYRGVEDPDVWVDDALELAATCRAVEGLWVGIWHPNLTPALGFPGALEAYERLVGALVAREPFVATMRELVDWRRARRAVSARALDADGSVVVSTGGTAVDERLVVRDADGRARALRAER